MNILIGLGLPWTISTSAGLPITIPNEAELKTMVYLMVSTSRSNRRPKGDVGLAAEIEARP